MQVFKLGGYVSIFSFEQSSKLNTLIWKKFRSVVLITLKNAQACTNSGKQCKEISSRFLVAMTNKNYGSNSIFACFFIKISLNIYW